MKNLDRINRRRDHCRDLRRSSSLSRSSSRSLSADSTKRSGHEEGTRRRSTILCAGMDTAAPFTRDGSNDEYLSIVSRLRASPSSSDTAKRSVHEEGARRRSTILCTGLDTAAWFSRDGSNDEYLSIVSRLRAPLSSSDSAKESVHEEGARRRNTILCTGLDTAAPLAPRIRG
jgi:hypothetical protein